MFRRKTHFLGYVFEEPFTYTYQECTCTVTVALPDSLAVQALLPLHWRDNETNKQTWKTLSKSVFSGTWGGKRHMPTNYKAKNNVDKLTPRQVTKLSQYVCVVTPPREGTFWPTVWVVCIPFIHCCFSRLKISFVVTNRCVENKKMSGRSLDPSSHMYLNLSNDVAFLLKRSWDGGTEQSGKALT